MDSGSAVAATTVSDLMVKLGDACKQVVSDAMNGIGTVLPYALTIAGAIIAIYIAYKIFKKFAK